MVELGSYYWGTVFDIDSRLPIPRNRRYWVSEALHWNFFSSSPPFSVLFLGIFPLANFHSRVCCSHLPGIRISIHTRTSSDVCTPIKHWPSLSLSAHNKGQGTCQMETIRLFQSSMWGLCENGWSNKSCKPVSVQHNPIIPINKWLLARQWISAHYPRNIKKYTKKYLRNARLQVVKVEFSTPFLGDYRGGGGRPLLQLWRKLLLVILPFQNYGPSKWIFFLNHHCKVRERKIPFLIPF